MDQTAENGKRADRGRHAIQPFRRARGLFSNGADLFRKECNGVEHGRRARIGSTPIGPRSIADLSGQVKRDLMGSVIGGRGDVNLPADLLPSPVRARPLRWEVGRARAV